MTSVVQGKPQTQIPPTLQLPKDLSLSDLYILNIESFELFQETNPVLLETEEDFRKHNNLFSIRNIIIHAIAARQDEARA